MKIEIKSESFEPMDEIRDYQEQIKQDGKYGAASFFIGSMRDRNEGETVLSMQLEHYPGMTEKHLTEIAEEASRQWSLIDVLILHRTGTINVADPIVLVAVWSAHRAAAFEACRYIMEDLKSKAPFWKKETTESGEHWVEKNTPGYSE